MSRAGTSGLAALAALAALTMADAAGAQTPPDIPDVISPLKLETDDNGVNVLTGRIQMPTPVLSTPAAPNLRFDRVQNSAPYIRGTINAAPGGGGGLSMASFSVHTGMGTEAFRCVDFDCTSVTGTGSNFVMNAWRFQQAGTGGLWIFNQKNVDTSTSNPRTIQYYASSVTYPTGETISYSYDTYTYNNIVYHRPTTVSSNLGYHISITYQGNAFPSNEWGMPAVATLVRTGGETIGRLTFSGDTITDLGGRVYTCTGCQQALGANVETAAGSFRLPGEASPHLVVAAVPERPLVASLTRDGATWNYAYTNLRLDGPTWRYDRLTVTGPNGYNMAYDMGWVEKSHVVTRIVDPLNRATDFIVDPSMRPTRATYPEGNRVDIGYDGFGNIVSRTATAKPNSGLAAVTETAFYPTDDPNLCNTTFISSVLCYRPIWSRDGLGRQTDYEYNSAGQLVRQDDPADANGVRRRTIVEYQASAGGISRPVVMRVCGVGTTCGTAQEIRTEFEYWGGTRLPSLVRQVDPATGQTLVTSYAYDAAGRVTMEDGPLPGTGDARYHRYDLLGRRTWEIDALGANGLRIARRISYRSADDKPIAAEEGTVPTHDSAVLTVNRRTDLTYDVRRNPATEAVSSGGTTHMLVQRTFDLSSRLECEAQRMNPAAFGSLPASACTLGAQGSFGPDRIIRNVWDAAGQLLQVQRAFGTPLQQNYATYTYTLNGLRRNVTDANGNRAELRYDGHDRLSRWVFPSRTTPGALNEADYEAYTWDAAGNRLTLRKRDGKTITFLYDSLNRMTRKTVPVSASGAAGYSVFYGYDLRNLQTFARFGSASGSGITTVYDAFGRPASSTNSTGGTARMLSYQYDGGSRRSRLTFPDGNYFTYDYAAGGQLTAIRENGGTAVATFAYDPVGRPQTAAMSGASTGYGYDPISRLASLGHDLAGTASDNNATFAYNPVSQIVTRTNSNDAYASTAPAAVTRNYTVNGLNQYTAVAGTAFTYDNNGNLSSDGSTSYVYDSENRLVSASGASAATLSYDPMGRLFQSSGGGVTTRFLYDSDELVAEYSATGALLRRYVHGLGSDDPVLWYEGATLATRRSLASNHQRSIVAVADASGSMVAINAYDPWGIPNAANQGRFGFTGQIWLPEIAMWHYKARIYSPALGRFLQTDPVGYDDQINLYAYSHNDPINTVDPTGERSYFIARQVLPVRVGWFTIRPGRLGFGHGYLAVGAEYIGDPNARVITFSERGGQLVNTTGVRGNAEEGPSSWESDRADWLQSDRNRSENIVQINAPDATVSAVASAIRPVQYGLTGPNSTTAARAAADAAQTLHAGALSPLDMSDFTLRLPGTDADSLGQIRFDGNTIRQLGRQTRPPSQGPGRGCVYQTLKICENNMPTLRGR